MHPEGTRISIWFFVGGIVLVFGVLVLGSGIYELISPLSPPVVLAELHVGIWWGSLMIVLEGSICRKRLGTIASGPAGSPAPPQRRLCLASYFSARFLGGGSPS